MKYPESPNRIVIREYDSLAIGQRWDTIRRMISRSQALAIEHFQQRKNIRYFDIGISSIKATNWVGSFGIGHHCIDVVPKIDLPSDQDGTCQTMENLLYMIATAGLVPVSSAEVARLARSDKPLIVAFMDLYVRELSREWHRGPIRRYMRLEMNRPFLRGKLLFQQQVTENTFHHERFFTANDEFTSDNPVSRFLKAAVRACEMQQLSGALARCARDLAKLMDEIEDMPLNVLDMGSIHVDRSILRFDPHISLAKLILEETSPESSPAGQMIRTLMFDMNMVFERFIANECKRALAASEYTARIQISGKSLLRRDGKRVFDLRPDIGVFRAGTLACLLDTKWKRLDPAKSHCNVIQNDMYQMYAYGKEFQAPLSILLYPKVGQLPAEVAEYEHPPVGGQPPRTIRVMTVDVSSPLARMDVRRTLCQALRLMVEGSGALHEADCC